MTCDSSVKVSLGYRRVTVYCADKVHVEVIRSKVIERQWKDWFSCIHFLRVVHLDFSNFTDDKREDMY